MVEKNNWPKSPKLIWSSNADRHDSFKIYAASKIEQGSKLVIGQHGGHYGIGKWSFSEDHQIAIADRYYSWGWLDSKSSELAP